MIDPGKIGNLLPDVEFCADGLFWQEQFIALFLPQVHKVIEMVSDSKSEIFIQLSFLFTDGTESIEYTLPLYELERTDWFSLNPKCLLNPDCTKAGRYLAYIIKYAVSTATAVKQHLINHLGLHIIDGSPVFCAGDRLYWPPGQENTDVILEPTQHRLAIGDCTEAKAAAGMMDVVNLSPDAGRVIFAHSALYIMRYAYVASGVTPCCIPFLVGKTGTQKTTYASFATQLYNRDKGIERPPRLNATPSAAEAILYQKSDCVIVLDDLFPAKSGDIKRNQEKTLSEITRIIGDGIGRARKRGNQVEQRIPTCGVLFTGEYLVGTGSDAARLLPIAFTTPIDTIKLQACQNEPLMVSTFFHFFLQWYVAHYHEIQRLLEKWLAESRRANLGVHDRLAETHFCLNTAYKLFLTYCVEKDFTTQENAQTEQVSFHALLTTLVQEQQKRVEQGQDNEVDQVDYLALIATWYQNRVFNLAKNADRFKDHDGLIHNKLLCLRSDLLMEKINQVVPSATITDVRQALVAKGALKLDSEGKNVKIKQRRFYGIFLEKLL